MPSSKLVLSIILLAAIIAAVHAGTCSKPYWDIPALQKFCTCFNGFISCTSYATTTKKPFGIRIN
uniref:Cysteine rich secreted protein n=1 Tax=Riptortus pedestris TaxID=329032 RepID=R4WNP2_RIPPE|nr:unknown secreted protein [Riptortus pedestris]